MMIDLFRRRPKRVSAITEGRRIYAIGDVHGRPRPTVANTALIEADSAGRAPDDTVVMILGDLIARGPDSAGFVALEMRPLGWAQSVYLKAITRWR